MECPILKTLNKGSTRMRKKPVGLIVALILAFFLRLVNLLYFHGLESDEALYAQVISALSNGYIPYKDIFVGHPPVYFYLAMPFFMVFPSLYTIRLYNVLLGLVNLFLIFVICRSVYNDKIATIAALVYALYPFAIYSSKLVLVDNAAALFITLSVLVLVEYIRKKKSKNILFCGLFAGLSCMTKFTGISVSIAIFLFILFRLRKVKDTVLYVLGLIIFPILTLIALLNTGIWEYFYTQTIEWQLIRFGLYPIEKLWFEVQGIAILSPLITFTTLAVVKGKSKVYEELMVFLFLVPLAFILLFKVVFLQYFIILLFPLCVLSARFLDKYFPLNAVVFKKRSFFKIKHSKKNIVKAAVLILVVISFYTKLAWIYGGDWFLTLSCVYNTDQHRLLEKQIMVGNYIKNITDKNEKIWSSNAAFSFLSERLIVPPQSEYWKFQGFFPDVWGYQWSTGDYREPIIGHPNGLFRLIDIQRAWEEEKPKLIIIDRNSTVDYFVWSGINNINHVELGLSEYIQKNYRQVTDEEGRNLAIIGVDVWERNGNLDQTSEH